nr:TetR/AcrR family transcriptional regulator [Micromonospora sp. DSM 115978]
MSRDTRSGTHDEILAAASRRFAVTGFKGTSLHDIASEVGCSKATLLYHFHTKEAILAELLGPAVAALDELDAKLVGLGPQDAQRAAVEGFSALAVRFRREISVMRGDIPELLELPAFAPIRDLTDRLALALAGGPTPADRLAAAMVLAGVPAVCGEAGDLPDEELLAYLIDIAGRTLSRPPTVRAPAGARSTSDNQN